MKRDSLERDAGLKTHNVRHLVEHLLVVHHARQHTERMLGGHICCLGLASDGDAVGLDTKASEDRIATGRSRVWGCGERERTARWKATSPPIEKPIRHTLGSSSASRNATTSAAICATVHSTVTVVAVL
jgi:hypothetical protein